MNGMQKYSIWVGILIVIAMGIYPPWKFTFDIVEQGEKLHSEKPAVYSLINNPPEPEWFDTHIGVALDMTRLLIQWGLVLLMVGGVIVTFNRKPYSVRGPPGKLKDKQITIEEVFDRTPEQGVGIADFKPAHISQEKIPAGYQQHEQYH
ncbi:hypothetical protein ACFL54_05910 [Planctomycetota bacterium]